MVSIALMGAGCGLAGGAAILYFSGYFSSPIHSRGNLALAATSPWPAAATASFDGRPIGVREALGISWKRVGR